jgi:DNA invertase Pin-like site-specific DNA recombinase
MDTSMTEKQIIHTSTGLIYTRERTKYQRATWLREIAPPNHGAFNKRAKLTDEQACRVYYAQGSHRAIAKAHGISRATVGRIKTKKGWKHIHDLLG